MTLKNKITKVMRHLHQSPTKMQGLFNVTHFERILRKEVTKFQENDLKLGRTPFGMIKSGIVAQIKQPRSQRHFALSLQESPIWSKICGFGSNVPTQGTFSNNWRNLNYFQVLEGIFLTYQKLIPKKKLFWEFELPSHLLKAVQSGMFPIICDSSYISLSNRRFKYGTKGYKDSTHQADFGAKLHLCIDSILNTPINFTPTTGKVHESPIFELHSQDFDQNYKPWLNHQLNRAVSSCYVFDKGYWKISRFYELSKRGSYFICPKRERTFVNYQVEVITSLKPENKFFEARIIQSDGQQSLRWIWAKNPNQPSKWYNLITNIWNLDAKTIIRLYTERWAIEEIFKWLKQYTLLKTPLVNSWEGFLLHILFSLLVLLLLQYFIALLNLPRWQDNLTEVWRQLRENPLELWNLGRLRIPLAFIKGGMS